MSKDKKKNSIKRTASGQFIKGQSGNPAGGPKINRAREIAREHTEEAMQVLIDILHGKEFERTVTVTKEDGNPVTTTYVERPTMNDKRMAAKDITDRGWGKPTQPVGGDDEHDAISVVQTFNDLVRKVSEDSESDKEGE